MGDKLKVVTLDRDDDDWYEDSNSDLDKDDCPDEWKHRHMYSKFIDREAGSSDENEVDYPSGDSNGPEGMDEGSSEAGSSERSSDSEYDVHPCDHCGEDGEAEFNGYVFCNRCYTKLSSNNNTAGARRLPGEIRVTETTPVGKPGAGVKTSRLLTKLEAKKLSKKV